MARVESVNQNEEFAFKVGRVALFGSLLSGAKDVSDIDLAIRLEGRLADQQAFRDHLKQRVELAVSNGRTFNTFLERGLWPRYEIYRFLKARSRVFSIHEIEELSHLNPKEFKMLLGEPPFNV